MLQIIGCFAQVHGRTHSGRRPLHVRLLPGLPTLLVHDDMGDAHHSGIADILLWNAALTVQLLINPEAGSQPRAVKATEVAEDLTSGGSNSSSS